MVKNIIATSILLILGVVTWLIFQQIPDAETEKEKIVKKIEPVPVDKIDKIEIVRHVGSGSTLREEVIVFAKTDAQWLMIEPVKYKINSTSIKKILTTLGTLDLIDSISDNKKKHNVLEVDDELGIEVTSFIGDKKISNIIVGLSRNEITFVRIPGENMVYRVAGSFRAVFNKSAKNLRDRYITKMDKNSIVSVKYINQKGELELARKGQGENSSFEPVGVEIQNFDTRRAFANANSLGSLTTKDYIDEPIDVKVSGLDDSAPRVEFSAKKDGKPVFVTVWVGKSDKKKRQTYFKTSLTDQVYLISTHIISKFFMSANDFARTDQQVIDQEINIKAAEAHVQEHRDHAKNIKEQRDAMKNPQGGQHDGLGVGKDAQVSPEVMQQLREQMSKHTAGKSAQKTDKKTTSDTSDDHSGHKH